MAPVILRLPLENADFPLVGLYGGRTVAIPGSDVAVQKQADIPKYRPKLLYCQNVVPTAYGLQSVGYLSRISAISPATYNFKEVWEVSGSTGNRGLVAKATSTVDGQYRIIARYFTPGMSWPVSWQVASEALGTIGVTHANVAGQSYVLCAGYRLYRIDIEKAADAIPQPFTNVSASVTGITLTNMKGNTSADNYHIMWDNLTIYWSNPANPLDFTSSLITGAGSGIPAGLKGSIITCYPAPDGFNIYTTTGVICARFSGNLQYPWNFKPITGAFAILDDENVTHASSDSYNYAITGSGVVKFSAQGAEPIFPEVGEFLASNLLEQYSVSGGTAKISLNTTTLRSRITKIGAGILVISYGSNALSYFTHALVYDAAEARWGKLCFPHVYCFPYPSGYLDAPTEQTAFLDLDGSIKVMEFIHYSADATYPSVVIIGGLQLQREQVATLSKINVDAGQTVAAGQFTWNPNAPAFDIYHWAGNSDSLFGTNAITNGFQSPAATKLTTSTTNHKTIRCRKTALTHAVAFDGKFALNSFAATLIPTGDR